MMKLVELAREMKIEVLVDTTTGNRGWYLNLITNKKVRMNAEQLAEHEQLVADLFAELERREQLKKAEESQEEVATTVVEVEVPVAPVEQPTEAKKEAGDILEVTYNPTDLSGCNMAYLENKYEFTTVTDERGTYEITNKLMAHLEMMKLTGKKVNTVIIECEDCGKERMIKTQDQFQVNRCTCHMIEYRNAVKRTKRRMKKQSK